MEIVEQLLIDFNPTNLNNRCRNGQDYDNENPMNIRLKPNQNVNDLEKQHPSSLLEIIISVVTSIFKLRHCYKYKQYNEQTNLVEIVEQLLIDFNPRNLNNRCKNGQDYDYESLMNNNSKSTYH
jgi:hypothetical protein